MDDTQVRIERDAIQRLGKAARLAGVSAAAAGIGFDKGIRAAREADARTRATDHQPAGNEPREFAPNRAGRRAEQRAARKRRGFTR